jgi:hypothetical protein
VGGRQDSHPSLSSWCEGNVDESSVVLGPLPCDVSSTLGKGLAGRLNIWMVGWIVEAVVADVINIGAC